MIIDRSLVDSPNKAAGFAEKCERIFAQAVETAAERIATCGSIRAVTLSGPSCSGKTTASAALIAALKKYNKRGVIISIDDFYYSRDELYSRGIFDFEGIEAIDTPYFSQCVEKLLYGEEVYLPHFSFVEKKRVSLTPYTPAPSDIFIFEGIQAVYPEIIHILDGFERIAVFICVDSSLTVGNTTFSPTDIRLMRRCVRDHYHRATSLLETLEIWDSVRSNEERGIFPFVEKNALRIDSLIPYEIFIIGKEFLRLSENVPKDNKYFGTVQSLRKKLGVIMNDNFSFDLVAEGSLIREFSE